jgi:hypothetical protein
MPTSFLFEGWKSECDAVHGELNSLLAVGRAQTPEACQTRRLQFLALIERRNAAARKFLQRSGAISNEGRPPGPRGPALKDSSPGKDRDRNA